MNLNLPVSGTQVCPSCNAFALSATKMKLISSPFLPSDSMAMSGSKMLMTPILFQGDKKERGPRSLFLRRCENGFGFTLRHFIVYPPESYTVLQGDHRWGLRQGDQGLALDEPMDTIFVKNVRESSPAHAAGLSTGDRIIAVNGQTITSYTYAQVVQLIQQSDTYLHLLVVPKEDDILQRYFGETAHNPETNQRPLRLKSPEVLDQRSKTMIQHQQPALSTTQHHQHHHHHHHHHHHQQHNQKQHQTRPAQQDLATYQEQHHSRRGSEGSKREGGYGQVGRDYSRGVNPYYSGNNEWREDMVVIGNHAQPVVSLTPSSDGLGNIQYGSSNSVPAIYYPGSRLSLDDGRRESSVSLPNAGSNSDINTSMSSLESTSTLTGGQDGCSSDDSLIMSRIRKSFEQKEEFLRRPNQPISWNLPSSPNNQQSVPLSPRSQAVVAREFYARPQKFQRPLWPPQNPSTIATTHTTCRHQSPPPRTTLATVKTQNITNKPTHQNLRRVKSDIDSERDSLLSSSPLQSRDNKPFERASSEPREDHNKVLRGQFLCGGPVTNAPTTITNQYQDVLFRPIVTTTGSTGAGGARHGSGKTSFVTTLSRIHENIPAIDSSTENTSGNYTSSNYSDNLDNSVDNFRASSLPPSLPTESDNGLYGHTSLLHEEDAASDRYTAHPKLQLVSRRARQFETGQLVDDEEEGAVVSDRTSLYRSELSRLSAKKSVPNVAVRKREFESRSSSGNSSLRDGRRTHRESRSLESAATSQQPKMMGVESSGLSGNRSIPIGSKHLHCTPPRDFQQQRTEPPSSPGPYDEISGPVKLRARSNSAESWAAAMGSRGFQASRNTLEWPPQRALQGVEEPQRHKAVRQDSYLAAVRTPVTSERLGRLLKRQTALPMETPEEIEEPPSPKPTPAVRPNQLNIPHPIRPASPLMPLTAAAVVSQERISGLSSVPSETSNVDDMTPVVVRREKNCSNLAEEERLVRRVSYLKATWGDRMHVDSDFDASDTEASYVQHQTNTAPQAVLGATLRLDINKENFQLVKEGWLHCKITIIDGKRAGDRSWKQVWAVLRGPVLYLFKDRRDLQQVKSSLTNTPIIRTVETVHQATDSIMYLLINSDLSING
uniref:Uncharacterized protein n=1 Tax=Timema monikensis TaxID=170555 RepID=A0A7R9HMF6_9NEOP|nr:unnamed protein product [Timema monikensis]